MDPNDVIIVGAGPAGIAAAIQLKRYGILPTLFEKDRVGGLLRNAYLMENYPGFPNGISGLQLAQLFEKQMDHAGIKVCFEEVRELDHHHEMFWVRTNQREASSRFVILASGTRPRRLSVSEVPPEADHHILYEITPLAQVSKEKIAIVGSGDCAFDYALNLSAKQNQVVIFNRGNEIKCLPLLWQRARQAKAISYWGNTEILRIKCLDDMVKLSFRQISGESELLVRYLVVAIGRDPSLDLLSKNLKENLNRLQEKKELFVIGDVKNNLNRQVALCIGDGVRAGMEIFRKIQENPS